MRPDEETSTTETEEEIATQRDDDAPVDEEEEAPDRMEPQTFSIILAETMLGQVVTAMLEEVKQAPDVWDRLGPREQELVIERIEKKAKHIIGEVVDEIACEDRVAIHAVLESMAAKDDIKGVLKISKTDPQRHELLDQVGKEVLIIVADAKQYHGGTLPTFDERPDPQAELPLDGTGPNQPEGEEAAIAPEGTPAWTRDDERTMDRVLLVPDTSLGSLIEPEDIAKWSDDEAQEVERWCERYYRAADIGEDMRPILKDRPTTLGGSV